MNGYLVIIPTYNEIENIESIIRSVMALPVACHALVVDDGSPDGTGALVRKLILEFPDSLFLLERTEKGGLGKAYIAGFHWALERQYTCIAEMDADFSHPPDKLPELFKLCSSGNADVSIGSRYVRGGSVVNWPLSRLVLSRGASLYVQFITGMRIKDPTAGFVCYHKKVLEAIPLDQIQFVGYGFQIEMKYFAHRLGFKLCEIPIQFADRQKGKSKMNIFIIREALLGVFKLRFCKN